MVVFIYNFQIQNGSLLNFRPSSLPGFYQKRVKPKTLKIRGYAHLSGYINKFYIDKYRLHKHLS